MSVSTSAAERSRPMTAEERKVIIASSAGTIFEWYDFYLYGSLAAIIAKQFFSGVNPTTGMIFALLAFAAGFFVRPFGAAFFGRLGDRIGHLKTVRAMTALGVLLTAALVVLPSFALVAVVMLLAGASLAPIWPLSLALQSLIVDPRDYSRSNALLNGSYGLGTLAGPLVSGYIFKHEGGAAMFLHLAALWALALAATVLFRADDPSFRAIRDARARSHGG